MKATHHWGVHLTYNIKLELHICSVIWIHALELAMTGRKPWLGNKAETASCQSWKSSFICCLDSLRPSLAAANRLAHFLNQGRSARPRWPTLHTFIPTKARQEMCSKATINMSNVRAFYLSSNISSHTNQSTITFQFNC